MSNQEEQMERLQARLMRGEISDAQFAEQLAAIMDPSNEDEPDAVGNTVAVAVILAGVLVVLGALLPVVFLLSSGDSPDRVQVQEGVVAHPDSDTECSTAEHCYELALSHQRSGRSLPAKLFFDKACKLGHAISCDEAGYMYRSTGHASDRVTATARYDRGCELDNADTCQSACGIRAMEEPFDYAAALPFCERAFALSPDKSRRGDLAELLIIVGQTEAGMEHVVELLRADDITGEEHTTMSMLRLAAGAPRDGMAGMQLFTSYSALQPGERPGWIWAGMLHHLQTIGDPNGLIPVIKAIDIPRSEASLAELKSALAL